MITVPDLLQHSADLDTFFKKLHFLRPSIGIALVVDLMLNCLCQTISQSLRSW